MANRVISISRQFGSGGRVISERLAKKLGVPFYDKELIAIAAKESGLAVDELQVADEHPGDSRAEGKPSSYLGLTTSDTLFVAQTKVIRKIAQQSDCIIVGRCSDAVLVEEPHVNLLRVFIHAPLEMRIRRIKEVRGLSTQEATLLIRETDKQRRLYYSYYTDQEWGVQKNYDLALNSAYWGMDRAVALLAAAFAQL